MTACRLCRSANLWTFFSLGNQPLANDLASPQRNKPDFTAPLAVMRCDDCGHVQLTHTVPPEILFSDYRFVSGTSEGWHEHCVSLAEQVTKRRGTGFILDIGSNDGTLLGKFKRLGWKTLGVDPATNVPRHQPVKTLVKSWSLATAGEIEQEYGHADVIAAQNVLGHVDDPLDFLRGIKKMLKRTGEAIIEVPDLRALMQTGAFDTIYHEHVSYWSITAITRAAVAVGLVLTQARTLSGMHGGTLRVTLRHQGRQDTNVGQRLVYDLRRFGDRTAFQGFQKFVERRLEALGALFAEAPKPFWGYAASAKATVLLNALAARGVPLPEWVVDDTPGKQGLLIPGVRIPITKPENLGSCETLAVLAWNWKDGIKQRAVNRGFRGSFIIPLPLPHLEDV